MFFNQKHSDVPCISCKEGWHAGDLAVMQQLGQSATGGRSIAAEGPAEARAGPRIFIGKLNKDTSENDVRVSPISSAIAVRSSMYLQDLCSIAI